jgi:hypothetical protein
MAAPVLEKMDGSGSISQVVGQDVTTIKESLSK